MIIREDKGFEINSEYTNINFYPEDTTVKYIVDESTGEGKLLSQRIIQVYPYYDFVEESGQLIDIIELPKPE